MGLSTDAVLEIVAEMDAALAAMVKARTDNDAAYIALWRRARRMEEEVMRHPYC